MYKMQSILIYYSFCLVFREGIIINMNAKIINFLKTTGGALGFSLFGGVAYFLLAMKFILSTTEKGGLLLWFFGPAIICGAALLIIRTIKQNNENENEKANLTVFYLHTVLFIISVIFAVSVFK